ncbi:40S ribosomal protein S17.e.B [Elasticomyces elasticus]|nr:40S ribosomal protein S17.e.B [Elasticomyces elasticus]
MTRALGPTVPPTLEICWCGLANFRQPQSRASPCIDTSTDYHSLPNNTAIMGRVRTKTVKKSAKVIIERYYPKLTLDFETNKRICDEIAVIASKRLRNKIAGYTTHLMKRIQRGPVRGISFKLQEEERERKDQYVPEVSALDFTQNSESGMLDVDQETKDMLKSMGFDSIPVNVVAVQQQQVVERPRRFGNDRPPRT